MLKKYKQTSNRHQVIGQREFYRGDVIRTVAISERDAAIMNGMSQEHGFDYVLVDEPKPQPVKTEKELRAELFVEANELGLSPAKNIKTTDLQELINKKNELN